MTRAVWFGMWHCHCSTITATEAEIADRCPVHGAGLMTGFGAGREIVHDPDPAVFRYGFDPAGDCCPEHRRPVQPSLFDTDDGGSVTGCGVTGCGVTACAASATTLLVAGLPVASRRARIT